jgi:hypothetical protein
VALRSAFRAHEKNRRLRAAATRAAHCSRRKSARSATPEIRSASYTRPPASAAGWKRGAAQEAENADAQTPPAHRSPMSRSAPAYEDRRACGGRCAARGWPEIRWENRSHKRAEASVAPARPPRNTSPAERGRPCRHNSTRAGTLWQTASKSRQRAAERWAKPWPCRPVPGKPNEGACCETWRAPLGARLSAQLFALGAKKSSRLACLACCAPLHVGTPMS